MVVCVKDSITLMEVVCWRKGLYVEDEGEEALDIKQKEVVRCWDLDVLHVVKAGELVRTLNFVGEMLETGCEVQW